MARIQRDGSRDNATQSGLQRSSRLHRRQGCEKPQLPDTPQCGNQASLKSLCVTIASNTQGTSMKTNTPVSEERTTERSTKAARLTRTRRIAILKALADPKRFELLEKIAKANCPLGCSVASTALAIAPATLSHHIKELESAG